MDVSQRHDREPDALPRDGTPSAVPPRGGDVAAAAARLRAARILTAILVVLLTVASAGGLWLPGLYTDPVAVASAFRGGDLVTLVVVVPALVVVLLPRFQASAHARLTWAGLLAYGLYNGAFYAFGAAFNDLFLAHALILPLSAAALVLVLTSLDPGTGDRFRRRPADRWVAGFLILVAALLGGMWSAASLRFAVTGDLPANVLPTAAVHLVYALDLGLVVPGFALAGVALWRRAGWGYVAATVVSVYGFAYQLNYVGAVAFQARAGVPGVAAFDVLELPLVLGFAAATWVLLTSLRPRRERAAPAASRPVAT